MQIKNSRSRILKEDRLNKSLGPGNRTHSKLDFDGPEEPEHKSFIVEPVPKLKATKVNVTLDGTLDTELDGDHESISKIPLELFGHPKSNKWAFRKAEETRSLNKRLKFRFKKNHSPCNGNPEKILHPIEYPADTESLFKRLQERTGLDNSIAMFLKQVNRIKPPYTQQERSNSPYKALRSRVLLTSQTSKGSDLISPYQSHRDIGVSTTNPLSSRRSSMPEFESTSSSSPVKGRPRPPESTRRLSPTTNQFNGRLEPSLQINEKYVLPYQEPEIKLTPGNNVFLGRALQTGVKPKLLVNMNRITFLESQKESIPRDQSTIYDSYEYAKKLHFMKNNSPTKIASSHREKSPDKSRRIDILSSNLLYSSRSILNESPNKSRVPSFSRFQETKGSKLAGLNTYESRPILVKIDSNQYVLPDEKALQRAPTGSYLN
jgi:hypothetical protein